jgi:hypothetical protein
VLERVAADDRSCRSEFRIRQARLDARAGLDRDIDTERFVFFTVSGEAATRGSEESISSATAIFI